MRRTPQNGYEYRLALYAAIGRAAEARHYSLHDLIEWYQERYEVGITDLPIAQLESILLAFGGTIQRGLFQEAK